MPDHDLALRPPRWPFSFEKWYIDTLMPGGAVLLVYLARLNLLGVSMARVTANLFLPGGQHRHGHAIARGVHGAGDKLCFGATTIDGDQLSLSTPGLSGELRFEALRAPAPLGLPFIEEEDGRRLDWVVEVPDAEVRGELRWPGCRMPVRGRGYRDRVWLDLLPWRFPITELRWGRAAAGSHAATWVKAATKDSLVERCWIDGEVVEGVERPAELLDSRVLLDTAIYDLRGLRLGLLRPILRRCYGDPEQTKWTAKAALAEAQGVAIHEVVHWH